jgi:hypothetical protein
VLIDRAFQDEGTSYHYLPPSDRHRWQRPVPGAIDRDREGVRSMDNPVLDLVNFLRKPGSPNRCSGCCSPAESPWRFMPLLRFQASEDL